MEDILEQQLLIRGRAFATFLQLRNLSRAARKAFTGRMLYRRGLHELDRQSQPSRRRCHGRKLQDQPFSLCGLIGTAIIFSTESST